MTTWFNDLKELIWHPKSRGFDQIAEHGTIKKRFTYLFWSGSSILFIGGYFSTAVGRLFHACLLS